MGFIGINLIDSLKNDYPSLLNLDIKPPVKSEHSRYWRACDILNREEVTKIFAEIRPEIVVHLAARTDMEGRTLEDYRANSLGTKNVLEAIQECGCVKKVIITSTQFVCHPGYLPKSDEDYAPHTLYGQSKVLAEQYTRSANLDCVWTIIRPTNIWGPFHPRYPYEFWKVLSRGYYFHPSGRQPIRCYGYVENVVWQIEQILKAPAEKVNRKTFYVGDRPISLDRWVDGFAQVLTGRAARRAPRFFVRSLALLGDLMMKFGVRLPITSTRFRSMTEDYVVDMNPIFDLFGEPPISLEEGIDKTARWLYASGYVARVYV